jgi:transposase
MSTSPPTVPYVAFVGIDWADKEHAVHILPCRGQAVAESLMHDPEAIAAWVHGLARRWGAGPIAVAVELSSGPLIYALMQHEHLVLYPINPKQLARYRESLAPSGGKDDPSDARLLAQFLSAHHAQFKPLQPDSPLTRKLARLCEIRRALIDDRTRLVLKLTSLLKSFYPLALNLLGDLNSVRTLALLQRWPTPQQLQRTHPHSLRRFLQQHGYRNEEQIEQLVNKIRSAKTLTDDSAIIDPAGLYVQTLVQQLQQLALHVADFEQQIRLAMSQHEDAALFRSLPGAGEALAPRLLVALGSNRDRFSSAQEVQCYTGIAPVTRRSGQSHVVLRRRACPKFLRQTFHEFAEHSRRWCDWAGAFYRQQLAKGAKHQAAIRALAFKWIRIIFRMWKTRTPYDNRRFEDTLRQRNSSLLHQLPTP